MSKKSTKVDSGENETTDTADASPSAGEEPKQTTPTGSGKLKHRATSKTGSSDQPESDPDDLTMSEKLRRGVWIAEMWSVWPMFILAIIFAVLSTVYLVARPDLSGAETAIVAVLMVGIWQVFIFDYAVRLLASRNKWSFVKSNSLELFTVIFPFFRPLLILVYIWRLPVTSTTGDKFFRTRFQITVAAIAIFFLYFISTLVWLVEKNAPHAEITNWGDAMWWGVSTITTTGYGDFVPVTTLGRLLGSFLMIGGIFVVGVVSASVISSFTARLKTLTEQRTVAAQERWEKVKQIAPDPHYPRWATKERSFFGHHKRESDADAPSATDAPGEHADLTSPASTAQKSKDQSATGK